MRHFVQYHNPDKMNPYNPQSGEFGIFTNKPVGDLREDMVWLVSRRGKPSRYILCEVFVVDDVKTLSGDTFKNYVTGEQGWSFTTPVAIGDKPWFEKLRRRTGNFAFGL